jgi:rubredoxin
MENVIKNEKAIVNEEQLDNVSGGTSYNDVAASYPCSVCGVLYPSFNMVVYHNKRVCNKCMKEINNR